MPADVPSAARRELDGELERRAARTADEGADLALAAGFSEAEAVPRRALGNAWATIVGAAAEWRPLAVVAGSRGRSAVHSALMGSVSRGVAMHCSAPVLVVPAGPFTAPAPGDTLQAEAAR